MSAVLIRLASIFRRNRILILGLVSLGTFVAGSILSRYESNHPYALHLWFFGWISFLLVIGYFSTPTNSVFGKVAFGFVVIMVTGIAMKILHLLGSNFVIVAGLLGIFGTYLIMWFGKKR